MKTQIKSFFSKGFTVVELAVVITVIGVLVTIGIAGYGKWRETVAQKEVQSDLRTLSTAMENARNFGNTYPTTLPATFKSSKGVTMSLVWSTGGRYCASGVSTTNSTIRYFIDSGQGVDPKSGNCSASAPVLLAKPSPSSISPGADSIQISWNNVPQATTYIVKYGTTSPTTTASCTSSPCVITGLAPKTSYKFTITAVAGAVTQVSDIITSQTSVSDSDIIYTGLAGYYNSATKKVVITLNSGAGLGGFDYDYDLWSCWGSTSCNPLETLMSGSSTNLGWHYYAPYGTVSVNPGQWNQINYYQLVQYESPDGRYKGSNIVPVSVPAGP